MIHSECSIFLTPFYFCIVSSPWRYCFPFTCSLSVSLSMIFLWIPPLFHFECILHHHCYFHFAVHLQFMLVLVMALLHFSCFKSSCIKYKKTRYIRLIDTKRTGDEQYITWVAQKVRILNSYFSNLCSIICYKHWKNDSQVPVVHICGQIENSPTTEKQEDFDLKYELKLEMQCFNYAQNNFLYFHSHFRNQTKPKHSPKQTKLTLLLFH